MNRLHRWLPVAIIAVAAWMHGSPACAIFPPRAPIGSSVLGRSAMHGAPPASKTVFQPPVHRYVVVAPVPPPAHHPMPPEAGLLPGELPHHFSHDVGLMWFASPPEVPHLAHEPHALPPLPHELQWQMRPLEAPSYPWGWFGARSRPQRSGHVHYFGHTRDSILRYAP